MGATPLMTNKAVPKGGVVVAISMLRSMMALNQRALNPRVPTIGMKMGRVTIIMVTGSKNIPMKIKMNCMAMITKKGGISNWTVKLTRPWLAPV